MKKFACLLAGILVGFFAFCRENNAPSVSDGTFLDPADTIKYTTPLSFCQGGSVNLVANNAASGANFQWQQSTDGGATWTNVGSNQNNYTASTNGLFQVIVNSTTYPAVTVTVWSKPIPTFSFDNNNACSGTAINFTSNVSNGTTPYSYYWSFDDGNTSSSVNPTHSYTALGCGSSTFNPKLVVVDANGCKDSIIHNIAVKQTPDVQLKDQNILSPFSNCNNSPTPQNPNFTITVLNISPSASCINSYSIDWGDGGGVQNNVSFPLTHTYTTLGAFTITVSAVGANGCTNSKTYTVANQSNPAGSLGTLGATTSLCAPANIPFTISNWQLNSPGTSYVVNFGDGQSVTLNHPLNNNLTVDTIYHTYNSSSCPSSTFTATLQVINGCATTPYTAGNIQINTKSNASFTAPAIACVGANVCPTNTTVIGYYGPSCLNTTTYSWDFGDGFTSTSSNPCHAYASPGTYTITLTATSYCTGTPTSTTFTKQICITAVPNPSFTVNVNSGCAPLTVNTTNTTTFTSCETPVYFWSTSYSPGNCGTTSGAGFASGSTSSSTNPSFIFTNPGTYTIKLSVTSACGTYTTTQTVTVKSKPTVSIQSIPNACGGATFTPSATVSSCGGSTTTYLWTFGGGSPATSTSLTPGTVVFSGIGVHTVTLQATNECGVTTASQNFTINSIPDLNAPSNQSFCPGVVAGPFNFAGGLSGTTYSWNQSNTSIGLTQGSGNTATIPSFTTTGGSSAITSTFTLNATNNSCNNSASFVITVNPKPSTPTVTTPVNYCQNETASPLSATAAAGHTLNWYTTSSGGTASSTAPTPSTATVGTVTYYVSQTNTTTGCESDRASITVKVNAVPAITGTFSNPTTCNTNTGSISLSGLSPNTSYSVHYLKNGNPVTLTLSSNASGIITISNLSSGTYTNITVTINSCPSNEVGPFSLSDPNPPATPTAGSNAPLCAGSTLNLTASSATPGVSYSWTGPSFSSPQQNPTISNVTVGASGTYTVTATLSGCTSPAATVNVTINPKPSKPVVVRPVLYCLNQPADSLHATASAGNTLTWYDNPALNNPSTLPFVPSTATAGTFNFYVTQTNSFGCASDTSKIPVTVYPAITGNTVGTNQTLCSGNTPTTLTGPAPTGGNGSYTYQWQVSTDNGLTWNAIGGATAASYSPSALFDTTMYRRIVSSGPCMNDSSNIVTIAIQGTLANYNITAAQVICSGSTPNILNGEASTGGDGNYAYQWQSSPDGSSWTDISGAGAQNYQPPALTATTYYRRKTSSGQCSALSNVIIITVNPVPVMNPINNVSYCNNATTAAINFSSNQPSNVSYAWTNDNTSTGLVANGSGNIASFTAVNNSLPKIPLISTINVIPTYTANNLSCPGNAGNFTITVLPTITINAIPDTTVCSGSSIPSYTPVHDVGIYANSTVSYSWAVTGPGISLLNGNGAIIPSFTTSNTGSTDLVATITVTPQYSFGGKTCNGTPVVYHVTVKSPTPNASAGPDTSLCAATSYTMLASVNASTTGVWTQISGASTTIVNPAAANTQVTGLQSANTYEYVWTVTGFASCPATKDTVKIFVAPDLVNDIDTTTQTICSGQGVTVQGFTPSGGAGTYQYQWEQSTDGVNWTPMAGQTSSSLSFIPSQTIYVRRWVTASPCKKASLPAKIIVQAPISNNSISADQTICINTAASVLQGSAPAGAGGGSYQYQWQSSTDGINWTNIPAAINASYDPGIMTATLKFRRTVATSLCTGPQSSNSNVITITVNPNAQALFAPVADTGCAPFAITPAIINLTHFPNKNSTYQWYANGVSIGSGINFPGYTIANAGDSVKIKVVAVSLYGCLNDSLEHSFYTRIEPQPDFNISDTVGCGPLTVFFTNTTPNIGSFNYQWNFGNGQSSVLIQPNAVTFLPNPTYSDTTYIIKLSAISQCTTIIKTKTIRVKSKPKALFTPNSSVGCSPMTVTFNNTSKGIGNSYSWDFGDGSPLVNTSSLGTVSHTFYTGVQDTFYVKLIAVNECGSDTLRYAIVVSPNQVHLDFAINGNQFSGCSPHTVKFINNSSGASAFTWNFGDGNIISTTQNIDTVTHTYLSPGTYVITLHATNGCSDTTSTETVVIYPKPQASYSANHYTVCIGDSITFTNASTGANSYLWKFGDGNTSTLTNPVHTYTSPGLYTVQLIAYSLNISGTVCTDSISQQVQVVSGMAGSFLASDTIGYCAPFTVTFTNQNIPSVTAAWDFGDGNSGSGNIVTHTYNQAGVYQVNLVVHVPGGCTYITTKTVRVLGPSGSWNHTTGYLCNNASANFQVLASNTDSLIYNFGDGIILRTTSNAVFHSYANAGVYYPTVSLKNNAGCLVLLPGIDTIRVDKIKAGFTSAQQNSCGYTTLNFADTSHAFFGKNLVKWNFGDGNTGAGINVTHNYTASGTYPVQLIVFGNSGCSDTITKQVTVNVFSKPVASILAPTIACTKSPVLFNSSIQSTDAIQITQWSISNGVTNATPSFNYTFTQAGSYTVQLIAGTVNGCYDTTTATIQINPSPTVSASADLNLCRGSSVQLNASGTGVVQWNWSPLQGLSCYNCASPVASPTITTPYVVQGTNSFACSAYDTVVITVIQPLHMVVAPSDSICIGESTNLLASGATSYSWSPAIGLNNTTISNPTASPSVTTTYRVVGYDGFNCFTDTAFVTIGVGLYPTVNLGPDLTLATGTLWPLNSAIQNGPIVRWLWSPATDLSCATCALPTAEIKKDISYSVKVTTAYGCSASDTISIKTFCKSAQVFIPNAFTPNKDGYNDVLMVRASGIALVKSFRIFNRWGEVVFERGNFQPNNPQYGWDGKIKGVVSGPDVFVYTAEVVCENGSTFTYKGNITVLK